MNKAAPWSIKGVDFDVREAAKEAARRDGVTLGEWMNRAIADRAVEIGANAREFDADERLEAIAAQLARLSREADEDPTPENRREESRRRPDAPGSERTAVLAAKDEAELTDKSARERVLRDHSLAERRLPGRAAAREAFTGADAMENRRRRFAREGADTEALLEQAVQAFEEQADRVETRTARAIANVAHLIEASEDGRAGALAQVDARLAEIEQKLQRGEKEAVKPLRGMIASVHDRLGEIEARLGRKEPIGEERPLHGALEQLEKRIESISRPSEQGADQSAARQLDTHLAAILARLDKAEASPPDAGRDEQFSRLEKRFDTLMARLDRPTSRSHPSAAGPAPHAPVALKSRIDGAIDEIVARQRELDGNAARTEQPPPPRLAAMLDQRFEALARKFDAAPGRGAAPAADKAHIDRLQDGIEALSGRIEDMRRDFVAAGAHSRAAAENVARDLSARVEAALAAPSAAGMGGLEALRRDIAALTRNFAEATPRSNYSGVESAMRELANRVDAARDAMIRAAEARGGEPTSSAEIKALSEKVSAMGRNVSETAPRAAAAIENATRELANRFDAARDAMIRAAEARGEPTSSAEIKALSEKVSAMSRNVSEAAPRAAAAIENATRELANRFDAARDAMIRAAEGRREPTSFAEIEALGEKVTAMGRALSDLAPRSQVLSLENAVRTLTARIERSRDEGMREAVLAPIESLADDVRRALAEAGASANFEGVSRQLHDVEAKIEQLRHSGGVDRADFLRVYDQSEQIRAMIAEAMKKMAPIERLERQVGDLSARLEEVAGQASAVNAAQSPMPWSEIEDRLNDLARRIDRAGMERAAAPVDDARFDDLSRRLDFMHEALAARIENAQSQLRAEAPAKTLEPLLRSLTEKLDVKPAPQIGPEAIEALENRIAEISQRLERGDTEAERRLRRAVEELTDRLALARDPAQEDRNAREIADLREKTDSSDRLAQQTLSAVHETLEKVVDRLALLEEDVIEARGAAEAVVRAPAATRAASGPAKTRTHLDVDSDSFLMEPGAGRPAASASDDDLDDDDPALGLDGPARADKPAQANYIDIARRALAARTAAAAAEKPEAETAKQADFAARAKPSARFVRPLAVGARGANRRLPALLLSAVSVLGFGAYQTYRMFDTASPPMQTVSEISAEKPQASASVIAPAAGVAQTPAKAGDAPPPATSTPAPAAPSNLAPVAPAVPPQSSLGEPASSPPLNGAAILPGNALTPNTVKGAGLPDPLVTGAIGARPNALSAIQAGAQALAVKELAGKGNAAAQYDYGVRLAEGRGIGQDQTGAVAWFEKAAAQGLAQAQYRLGAIYEKGVGTARDVKKARDNYEKAAEQGHVRAMHNLAVVLAEGVDGKPDYAAAVQWFRRAAEYGVRDSQFNLAILYARGMGAPQNLGQSYAWFAIAALQGDDDAAKKRDEIAVRLDAATLEAAKKQVADFRAKTPAAAVNDPPVLAPSPAAAASAASAAVSRALSAAKI